MENVTVGGTVSIATALPRPHSPPANRAGTAAAMGTVAQMAKPVAEIMALAATRTNVCIVGMVFSDVSVNLRAIPKNAKPVMVPDTAKFATMTRIKSAAMGHAIQSVKITVVNRSAAQKTIYLAQHVLVSVAIVLVPRQSFIQIQQYTIVVEGARGHHPIVITKLLRLLAMMCISALTIFIIDLHGVTLGPRLEISLFLRVLWIVMA